MTPDKTPTDQDLLPLIEQHLGLRARRDDTVIDQRTGRFHDVQRYRDLAADILAKWGSPVVAVEPVAWWIPKAEQFALADKSGDRPFAKAWEPLYAAPQPTQAQAVAVPLIDEQIRAMLNKHPPEDVCGWSYRMGIEDAELHHGIKEGGQHAAN